MNFRSPILKLVVFFIVVWYTVNRAIADLFVYLRGVLEDQMYIIASEVMHYHWYVSVVEVCQADFR